MQDILMFADGAEQLIRHFFPSSRSCHVNVGVHSTEQVNGSRPQGYSTYYSLRCVQFTIVLT